MPTQDNAHGGAETESIANLAHRQLIDAQYSKFSENNSEPQSSASSKAMQSKKSKTKDHSHGLGQSQGGVSSLPKSVENTSKHAPDVLPDFITRRNELFDELKRQHDADVLQKEHSVLNVVLDLGLDKDGKPRPAMSVPARAWESTPGSFLKHVDKDISSDVVIAKVDGKGLWDLDRPLEYDCRISYIPFTSPEGRNVFWHSSAHVLGEAAECQYQCLLSHGPPVEQGFFYDMALADG